MPARSRERIPTQISPDILDTIGKSFRFRHGKGLAEWLKNSLDQYLRLRHVGRESRGGAWPILLDLVDTSSSRTGPNAAVIDFGGTDFASVRDFFLLWGSRSAATLGGLAEAAGVTGGHGNGGKFYMREMWKAGCRLLTWSDGRATSLIVDRDDPGTTGEWEFRDASMTWREALGAALPVEEAMGSDWVVSHLQAREPQVLEELERGDRGFTVVVGRRGQQLYSSNDVVRGGRWNVQKLVDELLAAPQARRPLRELAIAVFSGGRLALLRLEPSQLEEDPDWETSETPLPADLIQDAGLASGADPIGMLRIGKAAVQLTGRLRHRNALWVMDGTGNPIAAYPVGELPLAGHSPIQSFIHAELQLTFPTVDALVQNERERLVSSRTSEAILAHVADRIWERIRELEESQRESQRRSELQSATILNDALNHHARRFLERLQTEILVDVVEDPEGGGPGRSGRGRGQTGDQQGGEEAPARGRGGEAGAGGGLEVPGSSTASRRPRFPQVLLSGIDQDPASGEGASKHFTDRHPPLEQDDIDKHHNVWWINTTHPFAQEALRHGGARGHAFKSHQLFMFRDVVQREGLRILQVREAELPLDVLENELSEISNRFLAELPYDLMQELLE